MILLFSSPSLLNKEEAEAHFVGAAYRFEQNGWTFLHIEGSPYLRGFQHGFLMAEEIRDALEKHNQLFLLETGKDLDYYCERTEKLFLDKLEPEFYLELEGIADGAGLPFRQILAWNSYIEILGNSSADRCSAFIATGSATRDGNIVMAHNTWEEFANFSCFNLILDIQPDQGHRILMQAAPGYIWSGTDFFITSSGILGTETTIGGFSGFDPEGNPTFQRARKAMQYAEDIEQWVAIMNDGNNGGCANAWLLGDTQTGEIARFEQGLRFTSLTQTRDGYFTGYNAATDQRILEEECGGIGAEDPASYRGARRVRWEQLMEENYGRIDVRSAMKMIADHVDSFLEEELPSRRTICGHFELDPQSPLGSFFPAGAIDGKVVTSKLAEQMSFWARWGSSCGRPFMAADFLQTHPRYSWLEGLLLDFEPQPWVLFRAGEKLNGYNRFSFNL